MTQRKYTKKQLEGAVKEALSKRQVLIFLGIVPAGGNYQTLDKALKEFEIDISHFIGKRVPSINKKGLIKTATEEYLNNKVKILSWKLKNRLIKEKILQPICTGCGLDKWMGTNIPLELHHIDGDCNNNQLTNLCLLCPNCHALTDNYRGKKKEEKQSQHGGIGRRRGLID